MHTLDKKCTMDNLGLKWLNTYAVMGRVGGGQIECESRFRRLRDNVIVSQWPRCTSVTVT